MMWTRGESIFLFEPWRLESFKVSSQLPRLIRSEEEARGSNLLPALSYGIFHVQIQSHSGNINNSTHGPLESFFQLYAPRFRDMAQCYTIW